MAVNTMTMGPGTLDLGEAGTLKSFASQVTKVVLSPNVDNGDPLPVLSGEVAPGDRDETWKLSGTLVQDLGAMAGLVEWLFTNRGTTMPFEFTPSTAAGKSFSGDLTVEAVEIGGDVKTKPTSDFEWALVGDPVLA